MDMIEEGLTATPSSPLSVAMHLRENSHPQYHLPSQLTHPNPAGAGGATQTKLRTSLNSQIKRIPFLFELEQFRFNWVGVPSLLRCP